MIPIRLSQIIEHYPAKHRGMIEHSYRLAAGALADKLRGNGHPFIEHPLGVAAITAEEIGLMPEAVVAVFLHEATRGNNEFLEELQKEYSNEILTMARGLNNISNITPKETKMQAENYRKLIVSYSKDPRVTLLKLADRLEVMRHLDIFPKASIPRKVMETVMLYIPLAHQLGLYNIKSEMEDLAFRYSDPENYRIITNKLNVTQANREKIVEEFIQPLEKSLAELGIKYKLKIRTKTAYSIWKKMQKQQVSFEEVFDIFAIRFILDVPYEKEHAKCWEVYSHVTKEYKPATERLRDWITNPKKNGYESLHITVENKEGAHIEVQIRTMRMDELAENGHAAHWSYKGIKSVQGLDDWLLNVKSMLESNEENPYISGTQTTLEEIFVFTPTGDLKQLPKGACVLDFAFNIHSNLGVQCCGAKVNGKIYSIRDTLSTGDVVEIMSNKNQKPSVDWLTIVVSSKARNRIKSKLKEEEGKRSRMGRELLARRMKNWKMELNDEVLAELTRYYKMKNIGDICTAIYDEKVDLLDIKSHLTKWAQPEKEGDSLASGEPIPEKNPQQKTANNKKEREDFLVIGEKLSSISYAMAKCCNPIFGDDVFGFVSASGGVKIHRIGCPNATRLLTNYPYRVQQVKWKEVSTTTQFQTSLKVIGDGDASTGPYIMDCIIKEGSSIRIYKITERAKPNGNLEFVAEMSISVGNNAHLDRVTSAIRRLPKVKNILRVSQK